MCEGGQRVTDREMYFGSGLSAIDAKGRVAIPAQLRNLLLANSDASSEIAVVKSRVAPCLMGFDAAFIGQIPQLVARDFAERAEPGVTREYLNRQSFPTIETMPFDGSGRFILPPLARRLGKLDNLAWFQGVGDYIEIWDPVVALESDLMPDDTKVAIEFHMEQRGVK